jgi:peptidyl-prolyl cis-trans isomerase D
MRAFVHPLAAISWRTPAPPLTIPHPLNSVFTKMLQQIRDKITGWFAIVFLSAIAIVFIFWGIQFESSVSVAAATVNGEKIPVEEVRRAWQERQTELQQTTRDELPPDVVKQGQEQLVNEFIRRELMVQRAGEFGYRISDRELAEALAGIPALQVDGQFSRDRYAALLRSQGRSEADFEAELRRDLEINQLRNAVAASAFALPGEIRRRVELMGETRDVQLVVLPAEQFAAAVTFTPEEVAARYSKGEADFRTPESVSLQFVRLSLGDVAAGVEVTEESLRAYYEQVAAERYVATERRRARHVLVESGSDDAAALAKAEALAKRARDGEDFASLAAQNSDDPGSKSQGGDLGWSTRESFVAPFADALFAMQAGEIRGPVRTQFGYHVIKLEEIEAGHQRSLDEVRGELEADYRNDRAQAAFYERSQQLADEAFASLDSLEPVAQKLGLPLQQVATFTRQEGGEPLGNDRKLIEAAFSAEVLEARQNSPAISVGDDAVVVLRVTEHRPASQRPLEEVRAQVEASLRAERAQQAAEAAAKAASARLSAGESLAAVAADLGRPVSGAMSIRRNAEGVPPDVLNAIFGVAAPAAGRIASGVSPLPNGDVALFVVDAVRPGSVAAPEIAAQSAEITQQAAGQVAVGEFSAYLAELERTAKIKRNPKLWE